MAVTSYLFSQVLNPFRTLLLLLMILSTGVLNAAVLPEDRADLMYHRYEGGGMVIDGPSLLVRKSIGNNVSVSGNYYVDKVSSASIDVQTRGASEYTEERTEYSLDTTFLIDKTTANLGFTNSTENDYDADSFRLDVSHAFFDEMTTVSMGFSQGNDDITSSEQDEFSEELERRNYRFGISQILTKNLLISLNYESVIDEGYLQNPYRSIIQVRCLVVVLELESCDKDDQRPELGQENYPRTRNSDAFSAKISWHLPWPAAVKFKLGYFEDSWKIEGFNYSIDYTHRFSEKLVADARIRFYQQGEANFYANQFLYINDADSELPEFRGRDKELSEHQSYSLGAGISYREEFSGWIKSLEVNGQIDYFVFDYDNFLEYDEGITFETDILGADKYEFDAYALRLFLTVRY